MNRTGIVTDQLYIRHDPGSYHPESPHRLRAIYGRLESTGLGERLEAVEPRPATSEEICRVHSPDYYRLVASTEGRSVALDPDTHTSPDSFRAAELAAGGALALVQRVLAGELDNGFALVRPPGHHAERAQAKGFCLFNNVAICAEHALCTGGLDRVMVVDWDLHHGNGTMHSFFDRSDVLYFSTHRYPYYPGTGALQDVGTRDGEGYTVSVPLPVGMGDLEYAAIFRDLLMPVAAKYRPDLILVSAGFDTLGSDPLGGMRMSPAGYGTLIGQLMEMAAGPAGGRVVLLLEGGYDVDRQAEAVEQVLRVMLGDLDPPPPGEGQGRADSIISHVKKIHII